MNRSMNRDLNGAMNSMPRLGVNLDHFATLRQLRHTPYPDLMEAASIAIDAGAEQITVHLREDRRHIQPDDVKALRKVLKSKHALLNLEMAGTPAMLKFALQVQPDWVCLVPERRAEVTTEGGLNLVKARRFITEAAKKFRAKNIQLSLFIEPELASVKMSAELGADAVELHTGRYCIETQKAKPARAKIERELKRIRLAALKTRELGMRAHAGHGLDLTNVRPIEAMELIEEYNIGHFIVCRASIVGLERAVREMVSAIQAP